MQTICDCPVRAKKIEARQCVELEEICPALGSRKMCFKGALTHMRLLAVALSDA